MSVVKGNNTIVVSRQVKDTALCYHCGAECLSENIAYDNKTFCCEGCKLVYEIVSHNGMCDYYKISAHPGLSQIKPLRKDKYAYLDNEAIASSLYKFTDGKNIIVTLYIPGVHCSSCMWLLEHLYKLNAGITESRLNFTAKEVTIRFDKQVISLRQVIELLATIGYEPYISLDDANKKQPKNYNKKSIYKLGVAGFCFGNIMLMSFPEYLSDNTIEGQYASLFRILNLALSLPVFFYSASDFFKNAWKSYRQKAINIDAPVALAILITFARSVYEIVTGSGAGYLDSMSGIVFFMLAGRMIQDKTYQSISFHRDYQSYFPIAVNVVSNEGVASTSLKDLKKGDIIELYHDDIIPADAVITDGRGRIDYSFVTGESEPVSVTAGETIYAGGRQTGEKMRAQITKPVASSYLTSLWNHHTFSRNKAEQNNKKSFVHLLAGNFTIVLFALVMVTGIYWALNDPAKILPSVSAMLIIACPCALLLASTFTDGSLMRLLSINGLYLRDAFVIEQLGKINHVVFDKTGTLTSGSTDISTKGHELTMEEKDLVFTAASSSKHPYSMALVKYLPGCKKLNMEKWEEIPGKGIEAIVNGNYIKIGSAAFIDLPVTDAKANFYVLVNNKLTAFYIMPVIRKGIPGMLGKLSGTHGLSLLSGDNDKQKPYLQKLFGRNTELLFRQQPVDKLSYIDVLQKKGKKVLMIGDGLNDAGALQQSNVGITLADDINNFTPSCDAILKAENFSNLPSLLRLSKAGKKIINLSFGISLIYNIIGLYFSVQGKMNPLLAAILMPLSTLSIVLVTVGISNLYTRYIGLRINPESQPQYKT